MRDRCKPSFTLSSFPPCHSLASSRAARRLGISLWGGGGGVGKASFYPSITRDRILPYLPPKNICFRHHTKKVEIYSNGRMITHIVFVLF